MLLAVAEKGICTPYTNCRSTVWQLRYARIPIAIRAYGNCWTVSNRHLFLIHNSLFTIVNYEFLIMN